MSTSIIVVLIIAASLVALYVLYSLYMVRWLSSTPIYYPIPSEADIEVCRDNPYRSKQTYLFDLYRPRSSPEQKHPAVIFISGDTQPSLGRNVKDWKLYTCYGRLLACSGFAAVTFNRTMSPDLKNIQASYADIKALHAHLVQHADEYRIDIEKIAFWLLSGGGCYAGAVLRDIHVKALVCYYAILDARRHPLVNKKAAPDLDQYALVEYLKRGGKLPATYLAKAGKDMAFIKTSIDEFYTEAQKQGARVVLREHEKGRHGFDGLNKDETTKQIIGETLDFLKDHLARPTG